jgi:hypothetical protein
MIAVAFGSAPGGAAGAVAEPPPREPRRAQRARRAVIIDGWLYDAREFEHSRSPSDLELDAIAATLATTAAACAAVGSVYLPVLVPAKRNLVGAGAASDRRWLRALRARLRDIDEIELCDLLAVLRDGARHGPLYHRTDADWNDRGAFLAARAMLKEANKRLPALAPPALSGLRLRAMRQYRGSLAEAALLQRAEEELVPCQTEVRAEEGVVIDAHALRALRMPLEPHLLDAGAGHVRVYVNPSPHTGATADGDADTCLAVVGDAATLAVVRWLAECASRTTFFSSQALPLTQIERERAPVVFHMIGERELLEPGRWQLGEPLVSRSRQSQARAQPGGRG